MLRRGRLTLRLARFPAGGVILALMACLLAGCPGARDGGDTPITQTDGGPLSIERLNELLKATVVLVEVDLHMTDGSTVSGSGSGFVVNDRGRIITNAHVVEPFITDDNGNRHLAVGRTVRVVFSPASEREETLQAEVVRENSDLDLALLKVARQTPAFLGLGSSASAPEMTRIICAGHPAGLREISMRGGTVTAHRTFEGNKWLEHDADAEFGSSGGPVVDEGGRVVGVMTQVVLNRFLASMWAVPSDTLRDWLASDPHNDPPVYFASTESGGPGRVQITEDDRPPSTATTALEDLLRASGLAYSYWQNDTWQIEYPNAGTVYVEVFEDILRAWVGYGEMPAEAGLPALAFTFHDPVGRLSVNNEDGVDILYWEAQVPMGVATPQYLRDLCDIGATQMQNFLAWLTSDAELQTPTDLYPGGDAAAHHAKLARALEDSGLVYEAYDEDTFRIPFDNDVDIYVNVFNGVAYFHSYTGGMPGGSAAEIRANATEMLRFNWTDPLGRIAVDEDVDVLWECQVPMSYLTADYLYIVASVGSSRVGAYRDIFGVHPLNG
ncbi:MAG: S1 family peptidase [Armatimonadota bacterium]|jgi:hypothetical protein